MDQIFKEISNHLPLIFYFLLSSSFGGFLQFLFRERYDEWDGKKLWDYKKRLFVSVFFGIGGGVAISLVLSFFDKFPKFDTPEKIFSETIYIITLWIVSGFFGHRILPIVAKKVEERLENVETKVQNAVNEANNAAKTAVDASKAAEVAYVLAIANIAGEAKEKYLKEEVIPKLNKIINDNKEDFPHSRAVYFMKAYLLTRLGKLTDGIDTINEFIDFRKLPNDKNKVDRKDYADALYNLACYGSLEGKASGNENILEKSFQYLVTSIELAKENANMAQTDEDLNGLKESELYKTKIQELINRNILD